MTRRLLLSYLSLAALVLLGLEIPLGFVYSRAERERIVNSANDEAESVAAFAALSLAARRPDELAERASPFDLASGDLLEVSAHGFAGFELGAVDEDRIRAREPSAVAVVVAPFYLRSPFFDTPFLWWLGLSETLPRLTWPSTVSSEPAI